MFFISIYNVFELFKDQRKHNQDENYTNILQLYTFIPLTVYILE